MLQPVWRGCCSVERDLFGYAVHHAVRARVCIERGRVWQAEYWLSGVRDTALTLACLRRELPAQHGSGFDALPAEVRDALREALVGSLERKELLRALRVATAGLLREAAQVRELAEMTAIVVPHLRELTSAWKEERAPEPPPESRGTPGTG